MPFSDCRRPVVTGVGERSRAPRRGESAALLRQHVRPLEPVGPGTVGHQAERRDETTDRGLWRVISSMALVPEMAGAGPLAYHTYTDEHAFREKTEEVLHEIADSGGVVLGRAAAIVLADRADALHVRLDGPQEARIAQAVARTGKPEAEIRRALRSNDAARAAYVRNFYRADPAEARHYHLVIDTTAISWTAATDLVVAAARDRGL